MGNCDEMFSPFKVLHVIVYVLERAVLCFVQVRGVVSARLFS